MIAGSAWFVSSRADRAFGRRSRRNGDGITDTEIHASGGQPDRARQLAPLVPMQRAGTAEEVAASILWLLSEEASYVTATFIEASGGR
jgi:NAD(P)-dependent dehydrogenase (short-subunit alcohol dehydrogenase family)